MYAVPTGPGRSGIASDARVAAAAAEEAGAVAVAVGKLAGEKADLTGGGVAGSEAVRPLVAGAVAGLGGGGALNDGVGTLVGAMACPARMLASSFRFGSYAVPIGVGGAIGLVWLICGRPTGTYEDPTGAGAT